MRDRDSTREGFVLVGAIVVILVLVVSGMAVLRMTVCESDQTRHLGATTEAFYLAESAIERGRVKLQDDSLWREGYFEENVLGDGRGSYYLAVVDTPLADDTIGIRLEGVGEVDGARRAIEVVTAPQASALSLALLVVDEPWVGWGQLDVCGDVHFNRGDEADLGHLRLHCEGDEYTYGFPILPPPFFADHDHFPNATFYDVQVNVVGGVLGVNVWRNGLYLNGFTLPPGTLRFYNSGQNAFMYYIDNDAELDLYFDHDGPSCLFPRMPGDEAVVMNFGLTPVVDGVPQAQEVCKLHLRSTSHRTVRSTIVNARCTANTGSNRLNSAAWAGGLIYCRNLIFEPDNGIALVAHYMVGWSLDGTTFGTADQPGLVYITGDIGFSRLRVNGSVFCLDDLTTLGWINIDYDPLLVPQLLDYFGQEQAPANVSNSVNIVSWREIPAPDVGGG